jgi:hypothetical protein
LAPSKCCRSNNTDEAISSLLKRPGLDKKWSWLDKKRKGKKEAAIARNLIGQGNRAK